MKIHEYMTSWQANDLFHGVFGWQKIKEKSKRLHSFYTNQSHQFFTLFKLHTRFSYDISLNEDIQFKLRPKIRNECKIFNTSNTCAFYLNSNNILNQNFGAATEMYTSFLRLQNLWHYSQFIPWWLCTKAS